MNGAEPNPFADLAEPEQSAAGPAAKAPGANPFADLVDTTPGQDLRASPTPSIWAAAFGGGGQDDPGSLGERFMLNMESAQRGGTLAGAVADGLQRVAGAEREASFKAQYENLTQWQTPLEGVVAFSGQLFGGMAAPENFVPIGAGAKIVEAAGGKITGVLARVFAGATDAAITNAVIDTGVQLTQMATGGREEFSPKQLALSTGAGVVAGGAFGAAFGREGSTAARAAEAGTPEPRPAPERPPGLPDDPVPVPEPVLASVGRAPPPEGVTIVADDTPLGPVAEGFSGRWREAVDWLKGNEGGDARAALNHPEVGPIDVIWGDERLGLAKIVARHPEVLDDLPERLSRMKVESRSDNRIILDDPDTRAVVRLDYDGEAKTWLMTAYDVSARRRRTGGTTERPGGRQEDTSSSSPADDNLASVARNVEALPDDLGGTPRDFLASSMTFRPRGALRRPDAGIAAPDAELPAAVRLRDVGNELVAALDPAAVRQGRFTVRGGKGGKVMGQYSPGTGVVRVRNIDDFETLTHELGHHVEIAIGKPVQQLMQTHAAELLPMAYPGAAPRAKLKEGFAEYMRLRVTNPPYAAKYAPTFNAALDALLAKDHGDMAAALAKASEAYGQFLQQPSRAAVGSTIVSNKRPSWWEKAGDDFETLGVRGTIADWLGRAYTMLVDDLNPMQRGVRMLAAIHQANTGRALDLKVADDPYKLLRMIRGAGGAGHMDVMYGVHSYGSFQPGSASLRDALVEAVGAPSMFGKLEDQGLKDFGSYLWSRRALGEWERFRAGEIPNPPDKLTAGDHAVTVAEFEKSNPAFVTAAEKVHDWSRALWTKKYQAGLISREQWENGLNIKDYVPGLRHFDPEEAATKGGQPRSAKADQVKRFRGSSRDVVNPIESLLADAYETSIAIARNDAVRALDRLARRAGNGSGRIAERIPSHQLKATSVDPLEAIDSAGKAAGLSAIDRIMLRDAAEAGLGDAKATIFRPAVINEKGEPILFFRDGGELRALRLADGDFGREMLVNFEMAPARVADIFIHAGAKASGLLRTGITTSPDFLIANLARDVMTSMIFYGRPFHRLAQTARGMGDEIFSGEAARQYNAAAGIMGGANTAALRDASLTRDLQALSKKGYAAQRLTSAKGLLELTELAETGQRIGLFKTFVDEAKARGLSEHDAVLEAAWRARDYIDFDRHGSQLDAFRRLVPFFNAAIQGFDKGARQMIAPLVRRGEKRVLAEDSRAAAEATKAWGRLSVLGGAGFAWHALMSQDEDYRELSPSTRATHWAIKIGGKFAVIPKPYEAIPFLSALEAGWDALALRDARWTESFREALFTAMPPSVLEGNPIIKTYFELQGNTNSFTGAPIVPENLQGLEPRLQYTARTSAFAKALGGVINWPPAKIDHVVMNHLGSWGRGLLAMSDLASGEKPALGWDDAPFTQRFIKDASKGSRSTRAFWDQMSQKGGKFEQAAQSYRYLMNAGDESGASSYLANLEAPARAYVAVSMMDASVRRMHPMVRARDAVTAISALRREVSFNRARGADGEVTLTRAQRQAADDILGDLSMAEARNALVAVKERGYGNRQPVDTSTYLRELEAVSPELLAVLGDRYTTAKVAPGAAVADAWRELEPRVLRDGTAAQTLDLVHQMNVAGFELSGRRIKPRAKPAVPGRPNG